MPIVCQFFSFFLIASPEIFGIVNGIPTQDVGTHEQGLKDAVLRAVRGYIENNNVHGENIQVSTQVLNCFFVYLPNEPDPILGPIRNFRATLNSIADFV